MWLVFSIDQKLLRKLNFAKTKSHFLCFSQQKKSHFLQLWRHIHFSNAWAFQINQGTNELLKKAVLENMSYWQKESESEQ